MLFKMKQWCMEWGGVAKVTCLDEIYEGFWDCLPTLGRAQLPTQGLMVRS